MIAVCVPRKELGTRAEARNSEVERALSMGADYIFFMDSDQTMPDNALERMMAQRTDIAVIDTPPHDSNMENVKRNPDESICYCTIACSLIKASVFKKLEKPWFSSKFDFIVEGAVDHGKYRVTRLEKYKDTNVGEDIYFVRNALEAGVKIKVVPYIRCKHFKLNA